MGYARELAELATAYNTGNPLTHRNKIINGGMSIWQRGTSFPAIGTNIHSADRWKSTIGGTSLNLTASQDTSTPSLDFKYSLKFQQITSNATSVTEYAARQVFELSNVLDLAGKTVTLSFWYKSNITGTHGIRIIPLGTTGGTDTSVAITVNSANTWEYKTVTTTALSGITSWGSTADNAAAIILDIGLRVNGVGQTTVNANDYFNLTGVQLEAGRVATPFEMRSYTTELQLAQRYFYMLAKGSGVPVSQGGYYSSALIQNYVVFPTTMRTTPSLYEVTGTGYYVAYSGGTSDTFDAIGSIPRGSVNSVSIDATSGVGGTMGYSCAVSTNSVNSVLGFSAEL